jgi:hypothetical protein
MCIYYEGKPHGEVWYHCPMHGFIHRFLAYFLLLLLPLQSQAAMAVLACYAEMTHAVMVEHAVEDCHAASAGQPAMSDALVPDTKAQPENPPAPHSSPCGMSSSCLGLASIAVLPDNRILLIDPSSESLAFADEFYLSYIPENPERPPRLIRA